MNALLSVSDKTGIVEFAQALHALGIGLLPALSPAGLLPALVLFIVLWATGAPADLWWGAAVPVTLLVLLSVLTHFVGSVATTRITRPAHDRYLATPG